jgi:hypothetical protein
MAEKLKLSANFSQDLQHEKNVANGFGTDICGRKSFMTLTLGVLFSLRNPYKLVSYTMNRCQFGNQQARYKISIRLYLTGVARTKINPRGKYCSKRGFLFQCISNSIQPLTSNPPSPNGSVYRLGVSQRPCSYHIYLSLFTASPGTLEHFEIHITNTL